LNLYPPTKKMWHQVQAYPHEIIPIMDQALKDCMMEVAHSEDQRNRPSQSSAGHTASQQTRQSSEPVFPSSDRPDEPVTPRPQATESLEDQVASTLYYVRPYGLDQSTNMRELNPSGKKFATSFKLSP
jgi:DNA replication licensing factor MCM4